MRLVLQGVHRQLPRRTADMQIQESARTISSNQSVPRICQQGKARPSMYYMCKGILEGECEARCLSRYRGARGRM
eukprot:3379019-Pleurochrysis_carterae.AAC.6